MTAWYLTQRSVNIQILHVPKRRALHGDFLCAVFNSLFANKFIAVET